jgi:hypothetical protein
MRESGEGVIDMSSLEALKLVVNEDQDKLNQALSDLIGKQAITPTMGASLINDGSYASNIVMSLIQAAETLFVSRDFDLSQTVQDMLEDPHELDNVITKDPEPENNGLTLENNDGPEQPAK